MQDAFGVDREISKGMKIPKFMRPKPAKSSMTDDDVEGLFGIKKPNLKTPSLKTADIKTAPIKTPSLKGSDSPAARRAKELWQADQDKRTPQVRTAWKAGRSIND